jgi:hypothetical protein
MNIWATEDLSNMNVDKKLIKTLVKNTNEMPNKLLPYIKKGVEKEYPMAYSGFLRQLDQPNLKLGSENINIMNIL